MDLTPYLEDLESRIDDAEEAALWGAWQEFCNGRCPDEVFSPRRSRPRPPKVSWPKVLVNEALADPDKMALQQLAGCSALLKDASGLLMNVRCNYGTPIMPSLWGAEVFLMEDAWDCLPCSRPLGREPMMTLADGDVPDLDAGLGGRVFEMAERLRELLRPYPRASRWVRIYHPDIQGPIDICEMLWGSEVFLDLVDNPGTVHRVLNLVTRTYSAFMQRWLRVAGPSGDGDVSVHWSLMHRGTIMLRDDSAMNLSPAMFDEFVRPYDERLLAEFGGGAIHACGRVEHYVDHLAAMPGMHAFQMSQPGLNDMETVYAHTVDKGVALIGFPADVADAAMAKGRPLRGRVHVSR